MHVLGRGRLYPSSNINHDHAPWAFLKPASFLSPEALSCGHCTSKRDAKQHNMHPEYWHGRGRCFSLSGRAGRPHIFRAGVLFCRTLSHQRPRNAMDDSLACSNCPEGRPRGKNTLLRDIS